LDDIKKFQSMIGALQWVIQIGRFDINTAVMMLSSFRANPSLSQLNRCKHIYGYLYKMRNAAIRIRVDKPDYSALPTKVYDWEQSIYARAEELIPDDNPIPLGLRESLWSLPLLLTPTCIMTWSRENLSPVSCTSSTRLPLIGIPRSRALWRPLPMDQSLLPLALQRSRSLIFASSCATWGYLSRGVQP
jgi:hypothetical protein